MSRNLRHRTTAAPPKRSVKSRSSTINDSSDDDYEGVNLISDSEDDDEPDVEEAEEQIIMHEEEDDASQTTPRPTQDEDEVSWEGFEEDQDVLGDDLPSFDEHMARTGIATEATLLPDSDSEPGTRRVRFDISDSSSTISNDVDDFDDEYPFPELFVPQAELDPNFRKQIEEDPDDDLASSDGGFWDFQSGNVNLVDDDADEADSTSDSSGSDGSGYDTDEGETTEEEDLPKQRYVPASSVLRQHSSESDSSEVETVIRRAIPRTPRAGDKNGPRMGHFDQQPTRPFAVLDFKSKRLLMFKAKVSRRHSFDGTPGLSSTYTPDNTPLQEMSPMISNSANMMMSAMYNPDYPLGQFLGGEVLGPPEAFFPFTSISATGEITQDDPSSYDEDDIEDVDILNLEDLIDFPDEETSDGAEEHDDCLSPTDGGRFSTPRPTTATSEDQVHPLLLSNPRLVGAFRNNQDTHKLLSGSNITADSMRFSSRFHTTAIQGIRQGHLTAATAPITPMRKHKPRPPLDSSPLGAQQIKRKFSGEDRGHKRAKSMN